MGMITVRHTVKTAGAKFSILIPTWNNLRYLQLCVGSILKNSAYAHQIVIHVNEGTDGSLDWVRDNGFSFTYSRENIGVCWAMNALRSLADAEYLVFMNDDMYVCPGWDEALVSEIAALPGPEFCLSATLLQPRKFWEKSVISPANYGETIETFDEGRLLAEYMNYPHGDWSGSTWPPIVLHRDMWDLAGGFSVEFSPGLYSDPDLSAKLYMAGVRHFKGVDKSRVYHFEARSTGRVRKNKGSRQFLFKWGITSSAFMMHILHRGERYGAASKGRLGLLHSLFRSRMKLIWGSFLPPGHSKTLWEDKA